MSKLFALIPAAGSGARMGADLPKQYLPLAGQPLLYHAAAALCRNRAIERVFLVLSKIASPGAVAAWMTSTAKPKP